MRKNTQNKGELGRSKERLIKWAKECAQEQLNQIKMSLLRWSWEKRLGRTLVSGEITLKYNIVLSGPDWRVEIIFTLIEQCDRTHCWPMKSVSVGLEQTAILYNK